MANSLPGPLKRNVTPEDFPEFLLCPANSQSIDEDVAKSKGYHFKQKQGGFFNSLKSSTP